VKATVQRCELALHEIFGRDGLAVYGLDVVRFVSWDGEPLRRGVDWHPQRDHERAVRCIRRAGVNLPKGFESDRLVIDAVVALAEASGVRAIAVYRGDEFRGYRARARKNGKRRRDRDSAGGAHCRDQCKGNASSMRSK
jgi:hypothetical protein